MIHFGTGGFRGVIGDDFTKANIKLVAEGLSIMIHEDKSDKPVYIGYDYRFMSEQAAIYMADTLAANGIEVLLSDSPSPTPTVMEASKAMNNDYGIMITSSHNPYYYNGIKLFQKEGMDAEKSVTDRLEKIISGLTSWHTMNYIDAIKQGKIRKTDILHPYLNNILNYVSPVKGKKSLKILLDPIYGTGALTLKPTLESMGITGITVIHEQHDVLFGGLLPNPIEENMDKDRKILLDGEYDFAVGTDSDCDRIAVLDEKGNYIGANDILASIYYYLVKYRHEKGDIVKNLATSNLIDALADKLGFKCHEVDVGFKNISAGMKDYDCLLGGESSGGLTMRGYIFGKDSTFATALFAEMVSAIGKPVSEIIEEVHDFASFHKRSYEDQAGYANKEKIISAAEKMCPHFLEKPVDIRHINNNFKYYFKNGDWALLRFSGTEPLIRIFFETDNPNNAKNDIEAIKSFIREND